MEVYRECEVGMYEPRNYEGLPVQQDVKEYLPVSNRKKKKENLPDSNQEYGKQQYWESRYASEDEYEWLGGFSYFKSNILNHLAPFNHADAILQLGCGNSSLSTDLRKEGWRNITNIDISGNGLRRLRARDRDSSFLVMDMTCMPLRDHSFDIIIEKATLDSLLVGVNSPWDLESQHHNLVRRVLSEVKRLLKPGGMFLSITFAQPHFRVPLLTEKKLGWSVLVDKVEGSGLDSFLMVMQDGDPGPANRLYTHSSSLKIIPNQAWDSSDDEAFLGNLDLDSDSS